MMESHKPLVSVGLPIYNRPEGLRRTLECFINQTYENIEIIIADNCSPDLEVEKIAREYCEKDHRISYYRHDENKGWGYNTNFVIEKAKGDYFMRATDDDWWDITYIKKLMDLNIGEKDVVVSQSNFMEVDIHGNQSKVHIADHLPLLQKFTTEDQISNIKEYILQYEGYGKAMLYGGVVKTSMYKTDYVRDLILQEYLVADLLIVLYLLLNGRFKLCPEVLFKGTYDNVRLYDQKSPEEKKISLLFLDIHTGVIKSMWIKWNVYFYRQFRLILTSKLSFFSKFRLSMAVLKRLLLFYYDILTEGVSIKGLNNLFCLKRKVTLR